MWVWGGDEDGGRPRGRQSQGRIDWQPRWPLPRSSPLQSGEPRNSCNFSHHDNPPSHQKEPQWGFMPPVCFPGLLLCINRTALYMFSGVHCLPCFNIQSMIHPAAERSYCSLQVRACRSHTNPFCWNGHLSYFRSGATIITDAAAMNILEGISHCCVYTCLWGVHVKERIFCREYQASPKVVPVKRKTLRPRVCGPQRTTTLIWEFILKTNLIIT